MLPLKVFYTILASVNPESVKESASEVGTD
jgi:hypothetical protein